MDVPRNLAFRLAVSYEQFTTATRALKDGGAARDDATFWARELRDLQRRTGVFIHSDDLLSYYVEVKP